MGVMGLLKQKKTPNVLLSSRENHEITVVHSRVKLDRITIGF